MGKIDTKIYLKAALLTILVFVVGIGIGIYLDSIRIGFFASKLEEFQIDFSNLMLEELFFKSFEIENEKICEIYNEKTTKLAEEAGKLGSYLETFKETTKLKSYDLEILKQKYFLTNLQLWLHMKNLREKCNYNVTTILFFYTSLYRCDDCIAQGIILSRLKKQNPEKYMIFAIDADSKLGIVSTLKQYFSVNYLPTIIINEKVKLEGFYSEEKLKEFID
ncbi:MAG: hypothetical protein QXX30_04040 [Candidatus Aenigmatarchaeota archaeon]